MPVIGTVTCFPSQKFAFPRSYMQRVGTRAGSAAALWTGRRVDLYDPGSGVVYWTLVFKQRFWEWSSNRYTLDWVLEEAYNTYGTPPANHPLDVFVWFVYNPTLNVNTIEISPFFGQPFLYDHALPAQDQPYWFPP